MRIQHKVIIVALLFCSLTASAQQHLRWNSIFLENDVGRSDESYTNGARLTFMHDQYYTPWWARSLRSGIKMKRGQTMHFGWALGQNMYTPQDLTLYQPNPFERPYAGWLYVGAITQISSSKSLHTTEVDIGVIGPSSYAKQTQHLVHCGIHRGYCFPAGWHTQMKDQPAVNARYLYEWRQPLLQHHDTTLADSIYHGGLTAGNIWVLVHAGATLRAGWNLREFGPEKIPDVIMLSSAETRSNTSSIQAYGFVRFDGRGVGQNLLLEGNSSDSQRYLHQRTRVRDIDYGGVLRFERFRVAATHVSRSREYTEEPRSHQYWSIDVSWLSRFR